MKGGGLVGDVPPISESDLDFLQGASSEVMLTHFLCGHPLPLLRMHVLESAAVHCFCVLLGKDSSGGQQQETRTQRGGGADDPFAVFGDVEGALPATPAPPPPPSAHSQQQQMPEPVASNNTALATSDEEDLLGLGGGRGGSSNPQARGELFSLHLGC